MSGPKVDLQTAYTVVHTLHERAHGTGEKGFLVTSENAVQTWFQSTIADCLYERGLLMEESVVLASIYVAELLASPRGKRYRAIAHSDPALATRLKTLVDESHMPVRMLLLAEQAFFMFCFLPEIRFHRPIKYRSYALEFGRAAYGTHASMTDTQLGRHMERAFEPLGDIVRAKFMAPS